MQPSCMPACSLKASGCVQASKRKAEAEGPGPSRQAESVAEVEEEEDEQMQPNWTLEDEEEDDATNLPSKGVLQARCMLVATLSAAAEAPLSADSDWHAAES